jgi:hypothetical protein
MKNNFQVPQDKIKLSISEYASLYLESILKNLFKFQIHILIKIENDFNQYYVKVNFLFPMKMKQMIVQQLIHHNEFRISSNA